MTVYLITWLGNNVDHPRKCYKYIEEAKDEVEDQIGRAILWNQKDNIHFPENFEHEDLQPRIFELDIVQKPKTIKLR